MDFISSGSFAGPASGMHLQALTATSSYPETQPGKMDSSKKAPQDNVANRRLHLRDPESKSARMLQIFRGNKRKAPPAEKQNPVASSQNPYPPFLYVPVDVLLLILDLLPLSSRACLTLTCKPFYNLFRDDILKDERLAWPRLLATDYYDSILGRVHRARTRFLVLMEDKTFRYCPECLKLHPGNPCQPTDSSAHENIVDLCPCLAITFGDRVRLGQWLATGTPSTLLPPRILAAFQFSHMKGSAEPCLKHECSITNHAHIRADLAMTVTTHADSTRCLIIQTEYHLRWKVKPPTSIRDRGFRNESLSGFNEPNFKPIFICPHRSIFEIYGTVRLEMDCDICKTFAYVTNSYSDHAHPSDRIIIRVVRNLGGLDRERWSPWYFNSRCEVDSHYRRWYLGDRFGAWSKREYDDEEGPLYLNNHRRRTKTGSGLKKAIELKRAFKHPFSSGN